MPGDAATATQSFRFSRLNRLLLPADFQRVFQQATRFGDRYYTVLWQPSNRASARIGFAIAKKRIPRAVARNRLRRIARESFRHNIQQLAYVDIVVLAQTAAGQASNEELFRSLEKHWRRIAAASDRNHIAKIGNDTTPGNNFDG